MNEDVGEQEQEVGARKKEPSATYIFTWGSHFVANSSTLLFEIVKMTEEKTTKINNDRI